MVGGAQLQVQLGTTAYVSFTHIHLRIRQTLSRHFDFADVFSLLQNTGTTMMQQDTPTIMSQAMTTSLTTKGTPWMTTTQVCWYSHSWKLSLLCRTVVEPSGDTVAVV